MGSVNIKSRQEVIRTCRTCAFLGQTRFKKSSRQYGRIIWWCKHKRYLGSTKSGKQISSQLLLLGCKKHATKAERRIINAPMTESFKKSKAFKAIHGCTKTEFKKNEGERIINKNW